MGGGSSKSETRTDPETQKTTKLVREQVLSPLVSKFMPQWISALMGKPGNIPVVKSQTKSVNAPTPGFEQTLQRGGLAGTPYGNRAMAEDKSSRAKQAASVGPNLMAEMFKQVPGMISGTSQNIINTGRGGGSASGSTNPGVGSQVGQGLGMAASLYGIYSGISALASY